MNQFSTISWMARHRSRWWIVLVSIAFLLMLSTHALAHRRAFDRDQKRSIQVGGLERHYLIHVPTTTKSQKNSLVLVFHGGGGHARSMPKFTGFDPLANEKGFIVAYPDSTNGHWNDTRGLASADDVAFVRTLIDELSRTYHIDPNHVYATGISNGGFFVQRLACDLTGKIAAVASVAATMPESLLPVCKPSRPISVLFMQGTDDPLVHIEGGVVGRKHGRNISLDAASKYWREHDHTSARPTSEDLPDLDPADRTRVHRDTYKDGKRGTEVVVYTIQGGGHTWPGGNQYLPRILVGHVSHDIDATATIWQFFERQSLP